MKHATINEIRNAIKIIKQNAINFDCLLILDNGNKTIYAKKSGNKYTDVKTGRVYYAEEVK